MTRKGYNKLKVATARIFSMSSVITGVCGLISLHIGLIISGILLFVGGIFAINAIRDAEKIFGYGE